MFERSDVPTRIKEAKRITSRLMDHTHYLLDIHENNRIVLFSDALSKQIPRSYAANAFNTFREALHQIEIVRLCALWDQAHIDNESIPTAYELIDHEDVLRELSLEERARHIQPINLDDGQFDGPEEKEVVRKAIEDRQKQRADERAAQAITDLKGAIKDARALRTSDRLKAVRNLRNKHVAHYLTETKAEKEGAPIDAPKYGDERTLLEETLPIVQTLYLWINGVGLSFDESRAIDQKCAKSLWDACTFKIL